jgi:hypothetical protein
MIRRMNEHYDPNTITPSDTNIDASQIDRRDFADRAEVVLRRILAALGYDNGNRLTALDVLVGIEAWLSLLLTMKRDPSGSYARVWWEAFKEFLRAHTLEKSKELATAATNAFASLFPPFLEERPTYDDKDFADMRAELERQTVIAEGLRASYDEHVTRINELHKSCTQLRENQAAAIAERDKFDALVGRVWDATGIDRHAPHVPGLAEQIRSMAEELDASRRLIEQQRSELATLRGYCNDIEKEHSDCRAELIAVGIIDTGHTLRFELNRLCSEVASVRDNIDSMCREHSLSGDDYTAKTYAIGRALQAAIAFDYSSAIQGVLSSGNRSDALSDKVNDTLCGWHNARSAVVALRESDNANCAAIWSAHGLMYEPGRFHSLNTERLIEALGAKFAGALVPLAKPERVEPGQRWAKVYRIDINANHEVFANGIVQPEIARDGAMIHGSNWLYLGTDKV